MDILIPLVFLLNEYLRYIRVWGLVSASEQILEIIVLLWDIPQLGGYTSTNNTSYEIGSVNGLVSLRKSSPSSYFSAFVCSSSYSWK
jgi:hypothetical protein